MHVPVLSQCAGNGQGIASMLEDNDKKRKKINKRTRKVPTLMPRRTRSSSFTDSCSKATRGSLVHWYLHFFWGLPVLVIDVVSCAARGGRTGRRLGRISGTGTADGPCASGNASWARPNGRTSSHIPPSHSDTAFLLNTQTHATL